MKKEGRHTHLRGMLLYLVALNEEMRMREKPRPSPNSGAISYASPEVGYTSLKHSKTSSSLWGGEVEGGEGET